MFAAEAGHCWTVHDNFNNYMSFPCLENMPSNLSHIQKTYQPGQNFESHSSFDIVLYSITFLGGIIH